jgi:hypothetical protein
MRKRWMLLPVAAALLAGCTLGAKPGIAGRIQEAQRSLGTKLEVGATQKLKSGDEVAIFSYRKGATCGAGVVDMQTVVTQEGECTGPISPGQSGNEHLKIIYGYVPPSAGVARIVLRWADGTEAEATLVKTTFYYVADGDKVPQGDVSLTAYDASGKVIQAAPPPGEHKHGH